MSVYLFRTVASLGGGQPALATGISDLDLVEVGGTTRLYSASRPGFGGVMAFDPQPTDSAAPLLAFAAHGGVGRAGDLPQIALVPGWMAPQGLGLVLTAGFAVTSVTGWATGSTMALSPRRYAPGGDGLPADMAALEVLATGGRVVVAGIAANGGLPMVWTVPGNAALAAVAPAPDPPALAQGRWDRLVLADLDGRVFALAAASEDHRLLALVEDAAGGLQPVQGLGPETGLGLAHPSALAIARTAEGLHALVGGAGSSSVTVFRIGDDGRMTATDHVIDGLYSRFAGVRALEVVETAGRVLVLAAGGDDGLSLLLLLPGGRLVQLGATALAGNLSALAARAVATPAGATVLQVFAGGEGTGIAQLALDLGPLAAPQALTGGGQLTGGAGGDLLLGGDGAATLSGGLGDDILVSGTGAVRMLGGAGRDLFVMAANGQRNWIADYDPAQDRIDLSAFPMLRSLSQLGRSLTTDGARLTFGTTTVEIVTTDRRPLPLTHLTEAILGGLQRMPLGGAPVVAVARPEGEALAGLGADDRLYGGAGPDTLSGGGGDDRLLGEDGADLLDGGDGNDRLRGGTGDDALLGGWGRDALDGEAGNDRLRGGPGSDVLSGGAGDDVLLGDGENDHLSGGSGNDRLLGGDGRDTLDGGGGHDTLSGGLGSDVIDGGDGHDSLTGSEGADTLSGGDGRDTLEGGTGADGLAGGGGDDRLDGGAGPDQITGGAGDDRLWGGSGRDRLWGEDGDDRLWGDGGHDALWGGAGADTLDGGTGRDTLSGGAGADVFVFRPDGGGSGRRIIARITDFEPGTDSLDLTAFALDPDRQVNGRWTGQAGEFRLRADAGGARLEIDRDGDGRADLRVLFDGTAPLDGDLLF